MYKYSRRKFNSLLALGITGGVFAKPYWASAKENNDSYSVIVLGDIHYDRTNPEYFHAQAIAKWESSGKHKRRLKEFKRNADMWGNLSPKILKASANIRREDTVFMLQLGDLVQGDCMSDSLHITMLTEAMELLEKNYPNLPIVSVCGNHDIRDGESDTGSENAYRKYMLPKQSQHLARFISERIKETTFGFSCGKDYWLCIDFNNAERDVDIVMRLLEESSGARYTFVAVHGPVLPLDSWHCRWFYLGAPDSDTMRREMRNLFAKHKVIVLSGHTHTLEFRDWYGDGGQITEMIFNSVAGNNSGIFPADPKIIASSPSDWGKWIVNGGKPSFISSRSDTHKTSLNMASLYDEYRNGLRSYVASLAVGHYCLHIKDDSVRLEYYGHNAIKPTKVFSLR